MIKNDSIKLLDCKKQPCNELTNTINLEQNTSYTFQILHIVNSKYNTTTFVRINIDKCL